MNKRSLAIKVEKDELVIRIGINTLKVAAEESETFNPFNDEKNDFSREFKIVDAKQFANGVRRFLQDEEEDGSTVITRALDDGFIYAVENAYGVEQVREWVKVGKVGVPKS